MNGIILNNALLDDRQVDIVLEEGVIVSVDDSGTRKSAAGGHTIIDCSGLAVFPGLVNMHSHAPMTLFRGLGDDQPLDRWLNDFIWPAEQQLTDELVFQGTLHACREMLASGTTAFNDMYFRLPSMARAVEQSGIRARLGLNVFGDAEELDQPEVIDLISHPTSRVHYSVAPHSVYTVSTDGLRRSARACRALGIPMHIHMSETQKEVDDCMAKYGCRPWQLLDRLGILDLLAPDIIAAHCLYLSDDEIRLIGEHHLTVVHCPNSNLKLGSGFRFPMQELLAAGANVTLGTDGSASSNNLDMVEVMKVSALLQKGWRLDPTAAPADQILRIATLNGARTFGLSSVIAPQASADLFLVRLNEPAPSPLSSSRSSLSNLIYATHGDTVALTIVGGDIVFRNLD